MKITKAIKKQLQSTKKAQNLIIRGRIIWIDFQKGKERLRKSTKLKYSPVAFNFVKKNYEKYINKIIKKITDYQIQDIVYLNHFLNLLHY